MASSHAGAPEQLTLRVEAVVDVAKAFQAVSCMCLGGYTTFRGALDIQEEDLLR